MQGTIKNWRHDRGYGFIATDAGFDVFFPRREFSDADEPRPGQRVTFEVIHEERDGRRKAVNVAPA